MKQFSLFVFLFSVILMVACNSDATPVVPKMPDEPTLGMYGPEFGESAHVVRSITVKTTGEVSGEFSGAKGEKETYLSGLCGPDFANFKLALSGGDQWDEIWVTNYSKDRIGTAVTGTFELSWVEVTFSKYAAADDIRFHQFRGPGTLSLTTHDANPGDRRMVGTMEGNGLVGMGSDAGKKVDLQVSFDMDSSYGINE